MQNNDSFDLHGICTAAVSKALLFFDNIEVKEPGHILQKETVRDIVTDMDFAIQNIILNEIRSYGLPIVSEEKKNNLEDLQGEDFCFVIDPIDGTVNYASKIPIYGISVGVWHQGKPLAGAFGMPFTKELYYTIREDISYLNVKLLNCPHDNYTLNTALIAVSFSSTKAIRSEELRKKEFELFGVLNDASKGCLRMGSAAANVCYAAAGKFQAAYGFNNKIWDVCAALAIAKAAGLQIKMTDIDSAGRISYVVGCKSILEKLLPIINDYIPIRLE